MSNVNTDQRVLAAQAAPLSNPAATAFVQFAAGLAQSGNLFVPLPGQYKAVNRKVKVRVYGNATLATVASQTITVNLVAVNSAGTQVTVASTGAISAAAQAGATVGWYVESEVLLDVNAGTMAGEFDATYGGTIVNRTAMSAQPGFTLNVLSGGGATGTQGFAENQGFNVSAKLNGSDPTAVVRVLELSIDLL